MKQSLSSRNFPFHIIMLFSLISNLVKETAPMDLPLPRRRAHSPQRSQPRKQRRAQIPKAPSKYRPKVRLAQKVLKAQVAHAPARTPTGSSWNPNFNYDSFMSLSNQCLISTFFAEVIDINIWLILNQVFCWSKFLHMCIQLFSSFRHVV